MEVNKNQGAVKNIMTKVQELASSWSLVGSRFDYGSEIKNFEELKESFKLTMTELVNALEFYANLDWKENTEFWQLHAKQALLKIGE